MMPQKIGRNVRLLRDKLKRNEVVELTWLDTCLKFGDAFERIVSHFKWHLHFPDTVMKTIKISIGKDR